MRRRKRTLSKLGTVASCIRRILHYDSDCFEVIGVWICRDIVILWVYMTIKWFQSGSVGPNVIYLVTLCAASTRRVRL